MKGHVLHLSCLLGVVPGAWVDVGSSMSQMFVSPLYAISCGWLKILWWRSLFVNVTFCM